MSRLHDLSKRWALVVLAVSLIVLLGSRPGPERLRLTAEFNRAGLNIRSGDEVRLRGVPIGAIERIDTERGEFTAQLGARRVSDEIDALEVMSVPTLRYLVSTRLIAAYVTVLPLYAIGLYVQLVATRWTSVNIFDISPGIYDQYFYLYLPREDVFFSLLKVLVFITLVTFIHCYYGFHVQGGSAEVGFEIGRAHV